MNLLPQSIFLNALGWTLLHSLWQMGLLWLAYILFTADGKRFQSRQRYNIALVILATGALSFIITLFYQISLREEASVINGYFSGNHSVQSGGAALLSKMSQIVEPTIPLLSSGYLIAVGLLFIRLYRQYSYSHQLVTGDVKKAGPDIRLFTQEMRQRFTINKNIRIGLSNLVNTPLTLGFWKPVILLPVAAINRLSIPQTEAIILHELNHIKQNDYLVNLLIACLDILLFFNPFSRMLSGILMKERENSCDDMVIQFRYSPADYAKALLILESLRLDAAPILAISAIGNKKKILLNRVQRILLGKSNSSSINNKMFALLVSALLLGWSALYNSGKTPNNQASAVPVSVQVNNSSSGMRQVVETPADNSTNISSQFKLNSFNRDVPGKSIKSAGSTLPGKRYAINNILNLILGKVSKEEVTPEVSNGTHEVSESTPISGFVLADPKREFSIQENTSPAPVFESYTELLPFVPANSFTYQYMEDPAFPDKYVPTIKELETKEKVELVQQAMEKINWKNLQKELSGTTRPIGIPRLQTDIKKALLEVEGTKIEEELIPGKNPLNNTLKSKQAYLKRLQKFQNTWIQQKQTDDQKRELILMERVMQNKELQRAEELLKNAGVKKIKKIVVI